MKTKTAHIIPSLSGDTYTRKPRDDIIQFSKYDTKTLVIARFGMLDCGVNYKGTKSELCSQCNIIDNEDHRLNNCIKYRFSLFLMSGLGKLVLFSGRMALRMKLTAKKELIILFQMALSRILWDQ